jgi:hypothetical protein
VLEEVRARLAGEAVGVLVLCHGIAGGVRQA